jgi:hypothetical protein
MFNICQQCGLWSDEQAIAGLSVGQTAEKIVEWLQESGSHK